MRSTPRSSFPIVRQPALTEQTISQGKLLVRLSIPKKIVCYTFVRIHANKITGRPNPQIPATNNWGVQSLLVIDGEIWAGTNTGAILIVSAKVLKFLSRIPY